LMIRSYLDMTPGVGFEKLTFVSFEIQGVHHLLTSRIGHTIYLSLILDLPCCRMRYFHSHGSC
jgi:hypothetical protein